MRVSKEDVICGLPAPAARQLARAYSDYHTSHLACELPGLDADDARSQLDQLVDAGYLKRAESERVAKEYQWITTIKGNALAQASFGKPISRKTATRHLEEVVARARSYNASPDYLLTIASIKVFGSYLDRAVDSLGDLDLAITVVRRETDGDRYVNQVLEYAHASGRNFGSFIDELFWPRRELQMILKKRSPAISITNEDVSKLTDRFRSVYEVYEDPDAIPPPPDAMVEK
jgi:hypothetical protein